MKILPDRIDRLHLAALLLWTVPVVALLPFGVYWLWQTDSLRWWLAAVVAGGDGSVQRRRIWPAIPAAPAGSPVVERRGDRPRSPLAS